MSGYIHTISFKVLIDSEVVDFTFRVPRGTLLVQVLDELETTLKIQPRVIATVNHNGEIVIIENHYSTVEYLMQKHGTEFFAGGSSVVTFNHGEYIVDLEVPEATPFASSFRTACKSFSTMPRDVSIERQDGQVMDYEIFRMPTAFVLNSWGNFYRIVARELGDPLIDPPKADKEETDTEKTLEGAQKSRVISMVYPPKLDESDLISKTEVSEIDTLTDHFVESSLSDTIEESESSEPVEKIYPWEKTEDDEQESSTSSAEDEQVEPTIESLMDEIRIDSETDIDESEEEEFMTQAIEEPLADSVITDVSHIEAEPEEIPLDEAIDFDEEIEALEEETITEEAEEDDLVIFAQDFDEESDLEESDEEKPIFDEFVDEEEDIIAASQDEDVPTPFEEMITTSITEEAEEEESDEIEESEEEALVSQPFNEEQFIESIQDHYVEKDSSEQIPTYPEETESIEEDDDDPQVLEDLTEDLVIESEQTFESVVKEIDEVTEEPIFAPVQEDLPLNQRLEIRKQELASLEKTLSEDERLKEKIQQRTIKIGYNDKMNPRKIYPISVRISPVTSTKQNGHNDKLKIVPIFPGCYVTPHQEIIELNGEKDIEAEFTVTPLISRGTVNGKIGIWYKGRNILNINATSKIRNYSGTIVSSILAFIFGIMHFMLLALNYNFNDALATGLNNIFSATFTANMFMYIEIALLVIFLGLMVGFIFVGKPTKRKIKRKFYPVA
ncbi:MAG: hypothetical protein ACTSPM_02755, partial [Candidatus Heimdallarchaeota archaeon]